MEDQTKTEFKEVEIATLKPAKYNPRYMPADKKVALEVSMEELGTLEPLVVNMAPGREGTVIGGHQRLSILQGRGDKTALAAIKHLDEKEEKALNLALNNIGGRFHTPKLKRVIQEIHEANPEAPLNITGFGDKEVVDLLQPITIPEPDAFAKVGDADQPEQGQMTFNLTTKQRKTVEEALAKAQEQEKTLTSEKPAETAGHALVALATKYNEHHEQDKNQKVANK